MQLASNFFLKKNIKIFLKKYFNYLKFNAAKSKLQINVCYILINYALLAKNTASNTDEKQQNKK